MTPGGFAPTCRALLAEGVPVRFRASGSSMEPAIRDGELVTVAPPHGGRVRRGEIVLYASGRRLLAHRVRGAEEDGSVLICQGDHWRCDQEAVGRDAVIGRVVAIGPSDAAPAKRSEFRRVGGFLCAGLFWMMRRVRDRW